MANEHEGRVQIVNGAFSQALGFSAKKATVWLDAFSPDVNVSFVETGTANHPAIDDSMVLEKDGEFTTIYFYCVATTPSPAKYVNVKAEGLK